MTLIEIKLLSNTELLDLYTTIVEINHYDPYITPKIYNDLYDNGITQSMLRNIILERMA